MKMTKKYLWSKLIALGMALMMLAANPITVAAEELSFLNIEFMAQDDSYLIAGEASTINVRVLDYWGNPYSGIVSAEIVDSNGQNTYYPMSGTAGTYSLQNVILDTPGKYTLLVTDIQGNTATGILNVLQADIMTDGTLTINSESTVKAKLVDSKGNPLARRSVTVDSREVGGTLASYTTLSDGTFSFEMTPTSSGSVNFIFAGHIVGTLAAESAYKQERIGSGATDNASLSVEISQEGWTDADYVILTRDDMVADAMTAVPLSEKYDAPILMTSPKTLDRGVLEEIQRLGAENVLIIGGTGAVSANIEASLKALGLSVTRFAGADRYETAAKIALDLGPSDTVYLAYGHGEADAITASAFAAEKGIPILLTDKGKLPAATKEALTALDPDNIVVLGGTGVISKDLENSLKLQYSVKRYGGTNRYATEHIIFDNLYTPESPVYFTSALVTSADVSGGEPKGDALLAAALAAKNNGFVVALPPGNINSLSSAPYSFLLMNKRTISEGTVVGNEKAISTTLEGQLEQMLMH